MYKSIILNKIEAVKESRALEKSQPTCKDCKPTGHDNKNHYKCRLYKKDKADDGDRYKPETTKFRDQEYQETSKAAAERSGLKQKKKCRSCGSSSHKSKHSPDCPQLILGKLEALTENLGTGFQTFIRKLPVDTCLASGNTQCLTEACVEVSVAYMNAVVEMFEKRVLYYLYFLIQNMCPSMKPDDARLIVKKIWLLICLSDKFAIDFMFNRRRKDSIVGSHNLTLQDFTYSEVESTPRPVFVDPEMPTAKTNQSELYNMYVEYMLRHRQVLFNFYDFQRAEDRFYLYQQKQKAAQIMVNMIINGGKKVKRRPAKFSQDVAKVPLIVFGAGMFGKDGVNLKGDKCRATGVLWRAIKRREKEDEDRQQQQQLPSILIDNVSTHKSISSPPTTTTTATTTTAPTNDAPEFMLVEDDESSSIESDDYKLSLQQRNLPSLSKCYTAPDRSSSNNNNSSRHYDIHQKLNTLESSNLELLLSLETQTRLDAQEKEKERQEREEQMTPPPPPRPTRIKFELPVTPSRSRSPSSRLAYPKARPVRSLPEEGLTANALRHPINPKKPRRAGWRYLFGDRKEEENMDTPLPITLDSRVRLKMRPLPTFGYVRYIGGVEFGKGEYIGVELDHGVGNCDGSIEGKRYFDTDPNRGVFLKRRELEAVPDD
ncbi:uncharacterized protein BX663DRAFT_562075 [Cokeromyces recurvatus]|uniref:uncharacterized protein n=1 Tax=Cokeromyces recurvatus TaxID=90255 RepID=UPI00221E806C|nr:uncharacterized protein BX663DRAFT_562075 [Cokeromyces recurvatus]KAI7901591.1 hypothetical protein BX663DRAFT_562075 [Cokeromyces recurvatus]